MKIHKIQLKILELAEKQTLKGLTLRKIGELINEPNSPQKIKHHIQQLEIKGLLVGGNLIKLNSNLISLPIIKPDKVKEYVYLNLIK